MKKRGQISQTQKAKQEQKSADDIQRAMENVEHGQMLRKRWGPKDAAPLNNGAVMEGTFEQDGERVPFAMRFLTYDAARAFATKHPEFTVEMIRPAEAR